MSTFLQLHLLTFYGPANLNRDDLGRPKTCVVGGATRLRVSSQSNKRAWRVSPVFQEALGGHLGIRTKEIGLRAYLALTQNISFAEAMDRTLGLDRLAEPKGADKKAFELAGKIAACFGKPKGKDAKNQYAVLETEQMVHMSDAELTAVDELLIRFKNGERIEDEDLKLLRAKHSACDISMFGRMIAASPIHNVDAAVQVAHAFSVDKATVEDDFFTAVDDLNRKEEDAGAGHMGIQEFGSGLFYLYICVNRDQLVSNLDDEKLAQKALHALAEAACTISPTGKQNSFASRASAAYVLAERDTAQPRSLSLAFLDPIKANEGGMLDTAVAKLRNTRDKMNAAYGQSPAMKECCVPTGEGSMQAVWAFFAE